MRGCESVWVCEGKGLGGWELSRCGWGGLGGVEGGGQEREGGSGCKPCLLQRLLLLLWLWSAMLQHCLGPSAARLWDREGQCRGQHGGHTRQLRRLWRLRVVKGGGSCLLRGGPIAATSTAAAAAAAVCILTDAFDDDTLMLCCKHL